MFLCAGIVGISQVANQISGSNALCNLWKESEGRIVLGFFYMSAKRLRDTGCQYENAMKKEYRYSEE